MNILIIGGNGFIGSHLTESLSKSNNDITVFDRAENLYTGELDNVNYIYGDFNQTSLLKKISGKFDIIFHLLSTTVPTTANLNPMLDVESNLMNTISFLQSLESTKLKKIIYISSGGTVYGNPSKLPINETHNLNPVGSYGIVKVAIESYIKFFSNKFNIPYLIIRPSNPYGPRQSYKGNQGVISTFLYNMINKVDLNVWGDGSNIRDYIYIKDLVDFIKLSGLSKETGIFNVGSGEGQSILELIEETKKVTLSSPEINFSQNKKSGINNIVLDISKAKNIFDWKPNFSLSEGVKLHYEWLKTTID
jgi:UDP-glucose 4-epimerase